jgi:hypothetical protein
MFAVSLRNADHLRRYSIQSLAGEGWEVTVEEDRALRRRAR